MPSSSAILPARTPHPLFAQYVALCDEVAHHLQKRSLFSARHFARHLLDVTQGSLRVLLQRSSSFVLVVEERHGVKISWQGITYGSLHVARSLSSSTLLPLPLTLADALAEHCGALLHQLDTEHYVHLRRAPLPGALPRLDTLRPQERRVLKLMAQGCTTAEIGEHLSLAPRVVENYRQRMYGILGVDNAEDAAYLGLRMGILEEHASALERPKARRTGTKLL